MISFSISKARLIDGFPKKNYNCDKMISVGFRSIALVVGRQVVLAGRGGKLGNSYNRCMVLCS